MSIVRDRGVAGGYRIQVVTGDDIIDTYLNNKYVKSCMGKKIALRRIQFYKFCEGLKLLRVIKDDTVHLRSLLWTATLKNTKTLVRMLDRVYCKPSTLINPRRAWYESPMYKKDAAWNIFLENWSKYAEQRNSAKALEVTVKPNTLKVYPYMDTFIYLSEDKKLLSNARDYKLSAYELSNTRGAPRLLLPHRDRYGQHII